MSHLRHLLVSGLTAAGLTISATLVTLVVPAEAATPSGTIATLRPLETFTTSMYDGSPHAAADHLSTYVDTAGNLGVVSIDTDQGTLTVDTYDNTTYEKVGETHTVSFDAYPLFGGVYTAPDGQHYLLTGRKNLQEDDNREVVSVRRFAADWSPAGQATVTGGVTQGIKGIYVPFDFSAPDMLAVGGRLVVHMARLMYATDDGLHHQADLTFEVDLATMTAKSFEQLGSAPYSSHSFNQLLTMSGNDLVLLDHGDAFPRALQLSVMKNYPTAREVTASDIFAFDGAVGNNFTGTEVTGLVSGPSGVLVAGSSLPHRHEVAGVRGFDDSYSSNIFVIAVDPRTKAQTFRWLTDLDPTAGPTALEPRITKVGADRFALLFSIRTGASYSMEYRLLDSAGETLASTSWPNAYFSPVSDPILAGSRLLWSGLDASSDPSTDDQADSFLFGLDLADPTAPVRLGEGSVGLSTDSALRAIGIKGGSLMQTFSSTRTSYTVKAKQKWVTVTGFARFAAATVEYGAKGHRGWASSPFGLALSPGAVAIERVRVTAESGNRTTYTLTLKRPR